MRLTMHSAAPLLTKTVSVVLLASMFLPLFVFAEQQSPELDISPVVIDDKGQPRDILKKTIKVVNTTERKLNLYPEVNEVLPTAGEQDFVSAQNSDQRAVALAQWIEISRGVVELGPGEEKELPFMIRIHLSALPGIYHARISFSEGTSRADAEAVRPLGEVEVNIEVQSDIKEVMQLNKFRTDNFFLSGDDVLFNYNLENVGNQELTPRGEIRIYNRKGEEVASLGINEEGKMVSPDQMAQLASVWGAAEGFGRFKAFLTVDYGNSQTASVQDTVYFWIVPWKQLLILSTISVIIMVAFALYFHRWFEQRHLAQLALAGIHHLDPRHFHLPHRAVPGAQILQPESDVSEGPGRMSTLFSALASGAKKMIPRRKKKVPAVARKEEVAPSPAPVSVPVPPPAVVAPSVPATLEGKPTQRSLREVLGPAEEWRSVRAAATQTSAHGHTINLRHLREESRPGPSHTIDLKKPRG